MNRLSNEKAQVIAAEYCTNGFQKVMALLNVGYAKTYASSKTGLKLYDNDRVKLAIKRIQANLVAKTGFTVAKAQQMYREDREFARQCNQAGASVTATTGICRLYGMDKDAGGGDRVVVINVVNYAGSAGVKPPKVIDSKDLTGEQEDVQGQG